MIRSHFRAVVGRAVTPWMITRSAEKVPTGYACQGVKTGQKRTENLLYRLTAEVVKTFVITLRGPALQHLSPQAGAAPIRRPAF